MLRQMLFSTASGNLQQQKINLPTDLFSAVLAGDRDAVLNSEENVKI